MRLERFKSIVLVILIISSIVLACQIWFNEKLWPDGYNFLSGLKNTFIGNFIKSSDEEKPKETVQEDILVPYNFFVYMVKDSDHAGYMLTPKDESFSDAKNFLHKFLGDAFSEVNSADFAEIKEEDWQNALCADGIYADYGAAYLTDTFLQLVNVTSDTGLITDSIGKMGRFAVADENGKINLYISDLSDNSFYRISCGSTQKEFYDIINSCREAATIDNRFSFFIGADEESPIQGAAVFAPYIILSESSVEASSASSATKQQINEKALSISESIAENFAVNPKTARRYTDADENIVYVQNHSSLKLAKDGYIEYLATTADGGLALRENADSDTPLALVLYPLVFMAEKLNTNIAENSNISVYVSSVEEDGNKYTVTLDYSFNGFSFIASDKGETLHSVTAQIEGGYLKSYKQYIADLDSYDTAVILPSSYGGIDEIFANMPLEERSKKINDMFVGYINTGDAVVPKWFIRSGDSYTIHY